MADPIREALCELCEAVQEQFFGADSDLSPRVIKVTNEAALLLCRLDAQPTPVAAFAGVTAEELACIMREMPDTDYRGEAAWLLNHPRLGPLLRGEGAVAPKRVVLPEKPPEADVPRYWSRIVNGPHKLAWKKGHAAGWAACRAEVERQQQQRGQADV